ncbi:hypothetical protein ACFE04_001233 [Oxalis oulophora]
MALLHDHDSPLPPPSNFLNRRTMNVCSLLAHRELSPRTKYMPTNKWGEGTNDTPSSIPKKPVTDLKRGLISWAETQSLQHLSAKYCPLEPPPRSTIAAAFSSDGRTVASTHGDHTVKIINYYTGSCLKVLSGHRRTPWVSFHPYNPEIVASGSLDHEVRIWNANTSACIGIHAFYHPIASIAFHAEGELLAVASGRRLYVWNYNLKGEASSPTMVLKTKHALRAVHFHPHAAPFLLTAEVNNLEPSDPEISLATSPGHVQHPQPPAIFMRDANSTDHNILSAEIPPPIFFMPSFPVNVWKVNMQYASRHTGSMQSQSGINSVEQRDFTVSLPTDTHINRQHLDTQPIIDIIQSELATSMAATEIPCTVKIRVWTHDTKIPYAKLNPDACRFTIPHVVLCSEMGAHFSPCGRFLAACVACTFSHDEAETSVLQVPGGATSPTRHPISGHQIIYELRIYSLEKPTFGSVLASRPITAAHCLTSIQFSPTSEHILVAYGRRHASLLQSLATDGATISGLHTILEEGKLRVLQFDRSRETSSKCIGPKFFYER